MKTRKSKVVVGLFVQQMDSEALLGVAITILGPHPSWILCELLGERGDPLSDNDRISFLCGDRSQVALAVAAG